MTTTRLTSVYAGLSLRERVQLYVQAINGDHPADAKLSAGLSELHRADLAERLRLLWSLNLHLHWYSQLCRSDLYAAGREWRLLRVVLSWSNQSSVVRGLIERAEPGFAR